MTNEIGEDTAGAVVGLPLGQEAILPLGQLKQDAPVATERLAVVEAILADLPRDTGRKGDAPPRLVLVVGLLEAGAADADGSDRLH